MNYCYYCHNCKKWFRNTHDEPEKQIATDSKGHALTLQYMSLHTVTAELGLSKSEIGEDEVTYTEIK